MKDKSNLYRGALHSAFYVILHKCIHSNKLGGFPKAWKQHKMRYTSFMARLLKNKEIDYWAIFLCKNWQYTSDASRGGIYEPFEKPLEHTQKRGSLTQVLPKAIFQLPQFEVFQI